MTETDPKPEPTRMLRFTAACVPCGSTFRMLEHPKVAHIAPWMIARFKKHHAENCPKKGTQR